MDRGESDAARTTRAEVFALRAWTEHLGPGETEVRGQVRHIATGATRAFRAWPELMAFVTKALASGASGADERGPNGS